MTKNGKINEGIFEGATINTPSMLAIADAHDALDWMDEVGGLTETCARSNANASALQTWVDQTDWVENLVPLAENRANGPFCLKIADGEVATLDDASQKAFIKKMVTLLEEEGAALDINGYRSAPANIRIWCGGTVDTADIEALTPWLDWAFASVKAEL